MLLQRAEKSYSCFRFNLSTVYHKRVDWVYHFYQQTLLNISLDILRENLYLDLINESVTVAHDFLNISNLFILSLGIENLVVCKVAYIRLFNKEKYVIYKHIKKNRTQNIPIKNSKQNFNLLADIATYFISKFILNKL